MAELLDHDPVSGSMLHRGRRSQISVPTAFAWRCLGGSARTSFPHPARRKDAQWLSRINTTMRNSETNGRTNRAFSREQQQPVAIVLVKGGLANFVTLTHIL